jgi:hypothetical protein
MEGEFPQTLRRSFSLAVWQMATKRFLRRRKSGTPERRGGRGRCEKAAKDRDDARWPEGRLSRTPVVFSRRDTSGRERQTVRDPRETENAEGERQKWRRKTSADLMTDV